MTDDERALIRAAQAEPDEDTLRLAYADWLDEQGGDVFASHAAFVRLQVRRSRTDAFDPNRPHLLEQEAQSLRKHQRCWNGRVHRLLQRLGFTEKVDARRGPIRRWGYHRGMIAHLTIEADALTAHADVMFALGPIAHLRFAAWPTHELSALPANAVAGLKVVSLAGPPVWDQLPNLAHLAPLAGVPLLDLRSVGGRLPPGPVLRLAQSGALPPVVLFCSPVTTTRAQPGWLWNRRVQEVHSGLHVIDPHGKWDALRLPFADLTGELLSPVVYQGASR